MKKNTPNILGSIREVIFGLEDGIISTMGVITGIASGTQNRFTVILAGLVVISVESLSMAAGTYLSNKTQEEYLANTTNISQHQKLHRRSISNVKKDSLFMGLAYIVGGIIPLSPYLFIPLQNGMITSILFSIFGLVGIGIWRARVTKTSIFKGVLEMVTISLSAAAVGYFIGHLASKYLPILGRSI